MAHSVDVSQPLPAATPVLLQWSHEDSDHGSRDAHQEFTQQPGVLLTKARSADTAAKGLTCLEQRTILNPCYGPVPQGDEALSSLRGQRFILIKMIIFWKWISLYRSCFCQHPLPVCELTEWFVHHWCVPPTLHLIMTSFHSKRRAAVSSCLRNELILPHTPVLGSSCLNRAVK